MDTSDRDIQFDKRGFCNHCRDHAARLRTLEWDPAVRQRQLEDLVAKMKHAGRNNEYDCIVGVSGGLDSTYVAYKTKQLGLRGLAVHIDNGWNSELAVSNIEKFLSALEMDLYTDVLDWEEFKDLQLSFLKSSVVDCEVPTDHALNAGLFHQAQKRNIKYILSGANYMTEGLMPNSWACYKLDVRFIRGVHKQFGSLPLKTFNQLTPLKYLYCAYVKGIERVWLLNYFEYNKERVIEELERELGYRYYAAKHYESVYTRFYQGYILPRKFKIDKRRAHLSTLICAGQITRDAALEEMKKDPYPSPEALKQDREFVVKKLGLTDAQFEAIMNVARRESTDYPSYDWLLRARRSVRRVWLRMKPAASSAPPPRVEPRLGSAATMKSGMESHVE